MIRATLSDGSQVYIRWAHIREGKKRATMCYLENSGQQQRGATLHKWAYQWSDIARCNPKDRFQKELGRRLSLQKVIKYFDREDRRTIWNAYWKRQEGQQKNEPSLLALSSQQKSLFLEAYERRN